VQSCGGEQLGAVHALGRRVRRLVAQIIDTARPEQRFFVNLHPMDLADPDLYDVDSPLSRHAHRVVLEITERTSLESVPDIAGRLAALRAMRFRIAIDDLGAGYAALSYLSSIQPDIIKIDMSLIRGIDGACSMSASSWRWWPGERAGNGGGRRRCRDGGRKDAVATSDVTTCRDTPSDDRAAVPGGAGHDDGRNRGPRVAYRRDRPARFERHELSRSLRSHGAVDFVLEIVNPSCGGALVDPGACRGRSWLTLRCKLDIRVLTRRTGGARTRRASYASKNH
jgi:hypothetical protein